MRRASGLAADIQLRVLLQQLEIGVHHIGDQRDLHGAPALFAGQIIGARRFGQAAQAAPHIQLPGERRPERGVGGAQLRARGNERAGADRRRRGAA